MICLGILCVCSNGGNWYDEDEREIRAILNDLNFWRSIMEIEEFPKNKYYLAILYADYVHSTKKVLKHELSEMLLILTDVDSCHNFWDSLEEEYKGVLWHKFFFTGLPTLIKGAKLIAKIGEIFTLSAGKNIPIFGMVERLAFASYYYWQSQYD